MARTGRDLTGQKFGKLTVLGFGGYEQNKRQRVAMWNCHCDCGSDCQVEGYLLVSGRRKSCGCIRRAADQMEGERFGKLVVLGADPENHTTLQKVLCRCDCGNVRSVACIIEQTVSDRHQDRKDDRGDGQERIVSLKRKSQGCTEIWSR